MLKLPWYFKFSLSHSVQRLKSGKQSSDFDDHLHVCQPASRDTMLSEHYFSVIVSG